MKKFIFTLVIAGSCVLANALPANTPPSGVGDPNCPVYSPCWCQQNPGNPNCPPTNIPIDSHYWLLIAGGVLMGVFYLYKTKAN
jgi:hypothetical protein